MPVSLQLGRIALTIISVMGVLLEGEGGRGPVPDQGPS